MNYFSYFSEIEETFVRRRGKNLLLSPLDWAMIEAWKEREIPLHVVLRAIDDVFDVADSQPPRKRQIKSLMYCREAVEELFAVWLETQTGKSPKSKVQSPKSEVQTSEQHHEIPNAEVNSHLSKISDNLRKNRAEFNGHWRQFSAEILADLERARKSFETNGGLENLETILSELDRRIDENLPQIFGAETFHTAKTETAAQLRSHKNRMSDAVYAETFKNLLVKNLRDRADVPRFSLFYL